MARLTAELLGPAGVYATEPAAHVGRAEVLLQGLLDTLEAQSWDGDPMQAARTARATTQIEAGGGWSRPSQGPANHVHAAA